ncbi:hypothetical protein SynA1825c_00665 [Synechococcus sp. A18-25c]|nr:hypothetical protein SynA1560_00697 [Synechococcus sp. A15-60]QNJ18985.1 hypothetical protein SynA1825c_00665 [Synechococcus sp. A18-25c]
MRDQVPFTLMSLNLAKASKSKNPTAGRQRHNQQSYAHFSEMNAF